MNFTVEGLLIDYYRTYKQALHIDLLEESPYEKVFKNGRIKLHYREEYVKKSVDRCKRIWEDCGFSDDLSLIYEKKEKIYRGEEQRFLESCITKKEYMMYPFVWECFEDEQVLGRRYVWNVQDLNFEKLAREIILSDIGGNLALAESVFLVDNKVGKVFFLYDDRGILLFT